jgi:xanthine/uracil permease
MSTPATPKTNGMAITGFVVSLIGCSLLGIIFSAVGMNQTKKDPSQGGRGLAIAGLVIGIVWLVIQILYWGALLALLGMEA